jgi:hypothetical protein
LAGVVAVLFAVAPLLDPNQPRPNDFAWTAWPLALVFVLYAGFGPRPADWLLSWLFGTTPDTKYEQREVTRGRPGGP